MRPEVQFIDWIMVFMTSLKKLRSLGSFLKIEIN
jgi:hypothetical protein